MKKSFAILLSVLIVFSFVGCSSFTDNSSEEVLEKKAVVMGYDKNYLPMGFVDDNGIYTGFDIELAKEISKRIINSSGVSATLNVVPVSAEKAISGLNDGSLDFLGNSLSVENQNSENLIKSTAIFKNEQVIAVSSDSDIESKEDLSSKKIAVISASLGANAASSDEFISSANIVDVPDIKAAVEQLKSKAVDAIIADSVAIKYLTVNGDPLRIIPEISLRSDDYCLVFNANSRSLKNKINSIIDDLKKDGTLKALSEKWFGENIVG